MTKRKAERPAVAGPGVREHTGEGTHRQFTATPAATLLPRLDAVHETGPGRWLARCPAHDDRHPSLTLRELDDGTLLLRCWAGCSAAEVVAAVGLQLVDLFPPRGPGRGPTRIGERWVPRDVLAALAHEATIAAIAAGDLARGEPLSEADRDRLRTASIRLRAAAREVA